MEHPYGKIRTLSLLVPKHKKLRIFSFCSPRVKEYGWGGGGL